MWLTASAWLPADLLTTLGSTTCDEGGVPRVAAAFRQGGPLDEMAPGPILAAFLADAADITAGVTGPGAPPPPGPPAPAEPVPGPGSAAPAEPLAGSGSAAPAGPLAGAEPAAPASPAPGTKPIDPIASPGSHPAVAANPAAADSNPADTSPADTSPADTSPADTSPADMNPGAAGEARAGLAELDDAELIGLIRGWRRQASLAAAGELAAVAELAARRHGQARAAGEWSSVAGGAADDEIAAALTLTRRSASLLTDRAAVLRELPATFAALAAGRIDLPRALVLINGLAGQPPALARAIENRLIGRAPGQTTGQLRSALNRALLAADPDAAERRRQAEEDQAYIERAPESSGVTASLAGRHLPVTATVAAWNRITALARQLKQSGTDGSMDQLRVQVFLALLTGQALPAPGTSGPSPAAATGPATAGEPTETPGASAAHQPDTAHAAAAHATTSPATAIPAIAGAGGLTGKVNLTLPLTTLTGLAGDPGELTGFGPITAHSARLLAASALHTPAVRWCVTVTDAAGHPVGHGCATRRPSRGLKEANGSRSSRVTTAQSEWTFTVTIHALAQGTCGHERETSRYRPPPSLEHLLQIRNQTCTAPGCRIPAVSCDEDHTIPYHQGGRTCECNLGPLCRHHHRLKQTQGWRLEQPEPGVFAWVTPSGWAYVTGPQSHAA
jgi:hypothetical protein